MKSGHTNSARNLTLIQSYAITNLRGIWKFCLQILTFLHLFSSQSEQKGVLEIQQNDVFLTSLWRQNRFFLKQNLHLLISRKISYRIGYMILLVAVLQKRGSIK